MDQNELKKAILWAEKKAKLREDMARETMGDLHERAQRMAGRYPMATWRKAARALDALEENAGTGAAP